MIRKPIKQWLNATFNNLVVVEDVTQTKLEKAISFDLTNTVIRPVVKQEQSINFEFNFDVVFRCPATFAGVGFLSLAIADKSKRLDNMEVRGLSNVEIVQHINNTEMIITKELNAFLTLEHNEVRETIEFINFEDALPCQKEGG